MKKLLSIKTNVVKKVLCPAGIKIIWSVWNFYIIKSIDFEIFRCELQPLLSREEIVSALKKENTKQLRMRLMNHSYGNILNTITQIALYTVSSRFAMKIAFRSCSHFLEQ